MLEEDKKLSSRQVKHNANHYYQPGSENEKRQISIIAGIARNLESKKKQKYYSLFGLDLNLQF